MFYYIAIYNLVCSLLYLLMLQTVMSICRIVVSHFDLPSYTESGQTLAQTSGCLDVLLDLFRFLTFKRPISRCKCRVSSVCQLVFLFTGLLFHSPQRLQWGNLTLPRSTNSGPQCPALSVGASTTLRMVL